jgi:hypothetical protein
MLMTRCGHGIQVATGGGADQADMGHDALHLNLYHHIIGQILDREIIVDRTSALEFATLRPSFLISINENYVMH